MTRLIINWSITIIIFAILGLIYNYNLQYWALAGIMISLLCEALEDTKSKKKTIEELELKVKDNQQMLDLMELKLKQFNK